jgi:hypothetical protein
VTLLTRLLTPCWVYLRFSAQPADPPAGSHFSGTSRISRDAHFSEASNLRALLPPVRGSAESKKPIFQALLKPRFAGNLTGIGISTAFLKPADLPANPLPRGVLPTPHTPLPAGRPAAGAGLLSPC